VADEETAATMRGAGSVALTWLGHAGFLIESSGGTRLAIDLFLSDHGDRLSRPPSLDVLGERLDVLLASHEHGDHLDLPMVPALLQRYPELEIVVPRALTEMVRQAGARQVTGLAPGDRIRRGDVEIAAVSAIHAVTIADGYSPSAAGDAARYAGYVVRASGGPCLWHSGDSLVSAELIAEVRNLDVTVALLPVNGRDYFRERNGVVGNCDAREAVQAAEQAGAAILVPMHHDLVKGNTAPAGAAADAARLLGARVNVLSMVPFVPHLLAGGDARSRQQGMSE
jgi:L-ascorbate 6-phosphate lactonase